MELKRGWWKKRGGGYAFVVVFRDGWWHGLDSDLTSDTWLPDGRYTDSKQPRGDGLITYCGDGPEPVEPVQLCIGWWEREDGSTAQFISTELEDGEAVWIDTGGNRYNCNGTPRWETAITDHNIVKRRPDMVPDPRKTDPRDAEIERLKAENAKLSEKLATSVNESRKFRDMADYHAKKAAELKNQIDNLRRLLGDH